MKRTLVGLAALVAVAFGLVTVLRWRGSSSSEAAAGLADAEKQRVRDFWAVFNRAGALRAAGDFHAAAPAYRESHASNPAHEDSLYYLGTSLQEIGEYVEAAATFRKMIELNSQSSRARSQLGITLSMLAPGAPVDFADARDAFLGSVEINREEAGPFLRLGQLELNQGRVEEALKHFQVAAGFGSPEGNFWVGYTYFVQGRNQDAATFLARALATYDRERQIAARGVLSEGDVLPAPGKPLTALERTGLKSILFLYWTAARGGKYPDSVAKQYRVQPSAGSAPRIDTIAEHRGVKSGGRGAWGDFDRDGKLDLLVTGRDRPVALYRNLGGSFTDVTASANLAAIRNIWDAVWADVDGDRDLDLYLLRSGYLGTGQNLLLRNDGHARFTDITADAGLRGERATARACFFDYDGDGRLDLAEVGARSERFGTVRLFRNTGGSFVDATSQAGIAARGTAVDCAVGDYNRDGRPDLFIHHWKNAVALYSNQGGGRFADATAPAGLKGVVGHGYSSLLFDYDRDGRLDLLLTSHAPYEEAIRCLLQPQARAGRATPRLFRNQGDGSFEEVTQGVGLARSFGTLQALAHDFDRDGWADLLLVNGGLEAYRLEPSVILRNVAGKEFKVWARVPGADRPANLLGAALADANRDAAPEIYFSRNPLYRAR